MTNSKISVPKISVQCEAMKVFGFLHGRWRGQKTVKEGEGSVVAGICYDEGRYEIGGGVFSVSGKSYGTDGDILLVENFGVFSYDKLRGDYTLAAHANEKVRQGKVTILGDGSIEVYPQGQGTNIRLTMIPDTSSSWREIGEQRDGPNENWGPMFEIRFRRIE